MFKVCDFATDLANRNILLHDLYKCWVDSIIISILLLFLKIDCAKGGWTTSREMSGRQSWMMWTGQEKPTQTTAENGLRKDEKSVIVTVECTRLRETETP